MGSCAGVIVLEEFVLLKVHARFLPFFEYVLAILQGIELALRDSNISPKANLESSQFHSFAISEDDIVSL